MIDAHAHLTDERFTGEVGTVLDRAAAAGIARDLTCGDDLASSERALQVAPLPHHPRCFGHDLRGSSYPRLNPLLDLRAELVKTSIEREPYTDRAAGKDR